MSLRLGVSLPDTSPTFSCGVFKTGVFKTARSLKP